VQSDKARIDASPAEEGNGDAPPVLAWLHVRAGLHRGARVGLHERTWVLGSAFEDDLALRDDGIAPQHLHLEIDAQQLALRASQPGWTVRGVPLAANDTLSLPHNHWHEPLQVAFGSAVLELAWADDAAPAAASPTWRLAGREWQLPSAGVRKAALVSAGSALMMFTSAAGWWHWSRPPAAPSSAATAPERADLQRRLQERLRERAEWHHVALATAPGKGFELRGRVQRRDDLDALLGDPSLATLAPAIRVLVEQDLRRQVHELTGDATLQVAFETVTPQGQGAVSAVLPVAEARQRLVVSGSTQRAGVAASLKLLNKELGARVEVVDRTLYEPSEADRKTVRVELPIRIGVINSAEGYVEDTSGNKYFEGSSIRGYAIESIDADKVVFNVSGKRIEFKVQ
jgi:hypothetical protein